MVGFPDRGRGEPCGCLVRKVSISSPENIFYDSIVYDKGALDLVFDISSSEHIMFGTDQPMPNDVDKLKEIIKSRTQQEQKMILSKNAEKLFKL